MQFLLGCLLAYNLSSFSYAGFPYFSTFEPRLLVDLFLTDGPVSVIMSAWLWFHGYGPCKIIKLNRARRASCVPQTYGVIPWICFLRFICTLSPPRCYLAHNPYASWHNTPMCWRWNFGRLCSFRRGSAEVYSQSLHTIDTGGANSLVHEIDCCCCCDQAYT